MSDLCHLVGEDIQQEWMNFLYMIQKNLEDHRRFLDLFVRARWNAKGIMIGELCQFLLKFGSREGYINPNGTEQETSRQPKNLDQETRNLINFVLNRNAASDLGQEAVLNEGGPVNELEEEHAPVSDNTLLANEPLSEQYSQVSPLGMSRDSDSMINLSKVKLESDNNHNECDELDSPQDKVYYEYLVELETLYSAEPLVDDCNDDGNTGTVAGNGAPLEIANRPQLFDFQAIEENEESSQNCVADSLEPVCCDSNDGNTIKVAAKDATIGTTNVPQLFDSFALEKKGEVGKKLYCAEPVHVNGDDGSTGAVVANNAPVVMEDNDTDRQENFGVQSLLKERKISDSSCESSSEDSMDVPLVISTTKSHKKLKTDGSIMSSSTPSRSSSLLTKSLTKRNRRKRVTLSPSSSDSFVSRLQKELRSLSSTCGDDEDDDLLFIPVAKKNKPGSKSKFEKASERNKQPSNDEERMKYCTSTESQPSTSKQTSVLKKMKGSVKNQVATRQKNNKSSRKKFQQQTDQQVKSTKTGALTGCRLSASTTVARHFKKKTQGSSKPQQKEKRRPQCFECQKFFSTNPIMRRHLREIHKKLPNGDPAPDEKFKCPEKDCDKEFIRSRNLRFHQSRVHDKSGPVICEYCGKLTRNAYALMKHKKRTCKLGNASEDESDEADEINSVKEDERTTSEEGECV